MLKVPIRSSFGFCSLISYALFSVAQATNPQPPELKTQLLSALKAAVAATVFDSPASGKKDACSKPPYTDFDFWIGKWIVKLPQGQQAGVNEITREQDGCLLVEHWTSARGRETGSSFNYYDVRDKRWHQLYLDNSGNAGAYPAMSGGLQDGRMILLTDEHDSPLSRWTWYVVSPGRVRQMAEQSKDGGKTWSVFWDSIYEREAQ